MSTSSANSDCHVKNITLEKQGADHYLVVTIIDSWVLVSTSITNSDCNVVHITFEEQGADHWPMVGKRPRQAAYPYTKP